MLSKVLQIAALVMLAYAGCGDDADKPDSGAKKEDATPKVAVSGDEIMIGLSFTLEGLGKKDVEIGVNDGCYLKLFQNTAFGVINVKVKKEITPKNGKIEDLFFAHGDFTDCKIVVDDKEVEDVKFKNTHGISCVEKINPALGCGAKVLQNMMGTKNNYDDDVIEVELGAGLKDAADPTVHISGEGGASWTKYGKTAKWNATIVTEVKWSKDDSANNQVLLNTEVDGKSWWLFVTGEPHSTEGGLRIILDEELEEDEDEKKIFASGDNLTLKVAYAGDEIKISLTACGDNGELIVWGKDETAEETFFDRGASLTIAYDKHSYVHVLGEGSACKLTVSHPDDSDYDMVEIIVTAPVDKSPKIAKYQHEDLECDVTNDPGLSVRMSHLKLTNEERKKGGALYIYPDPDTPEGDPPQARIESDLGIYKYGTYLAICVYPITKPTAGTEILVKILDRKILVGAMP